MSSLNIPIIAPTHLHRRRHHYNHHNCRILIVQDVNSMPIVSINRLSGIPEFEKNYRPVVLARSTGCRDALIGAGQGYSPGIEASSGAEESKKMKLYSFFRSSCAHRVRIALNLKGMDYEYIAVDLFKGEQFSPEFVKLNPISYVPVLVDGNITLADSFAILMYLEEKYPQHPLLPKDLQKRAVNYQAANIVSSSIQPLQNQDVLNYISEKVSSEETAPWVLSHVRKGFAALEKLLSKYAGKYATGDEVYLADLFLAPQIHGSVKRFNLDMTEFPLLLRLHEAYGEIPAFQDALPEKQPDAPTQ